MHVLFANHQLAERAGSELYTLELATAVRDRGHRVSAFTFDAGPIAQQLQGLGIPVFGPGDAAAVGALDCDLAHVHHAPCLYFLGGTRLKCPVIFSALGVKPALEGAPLAWAGVAKVLAVSEEVRDGLSASPMPPVIVRNWFDDRGPLPKVDAVDQILKVAVVSNHLDAGLKGGLDALIARRPGFSWQHFGLPLSPAPVTPELLAGFDAVITIGRTALLAGAMGKPCLLYDVHGCDGVLEARRLDALASRNFSGRLQAARPSLDELEQLLFVQTRRVDLEALAVELRERFGLKQRVDEILALHREAVASGIQLSGPEPAYARAGEVHAEVMAHVAGLRQAVHAADEVRRRALEDLAVRTSELAARTAELDARNAELAARTAELAARNGELAARTAELAACTAQLQSRGAEIQALTLELEARTVALDERTAELEVRDGLFEARGQRLARLWVEHEAALEQARELTFRLAQRDQAFEVTAADLEHLRASAGMQLIEAAKRLPGVYATYLALKRQALRPTLPTRVVSHK